MSTDSDRLKGRAKEAAGALSDDDDLRREGKADQTAGKAKEALDDLRDKADSAVDKAKHALRRDRD